MPDDLPPQYTLNDNGRRLPTGGPLKNECYGPMWEIYRTGDTENGSSVVIIPDPGDGSAEPLARKILDFLNAAGGFM
jgi:hypothetical protein